MTVGVYLDTAGGLAGAEAVAAVLTSALAGRFAVTLVHHHPTLTADAVAERFGVDVSGVTLRYEPPAGGPWATRKPWTVRRDLASWKADYSRGFDRFVSVVHGAPPHCHAAAGAVLVLFPAFDRRVGWPFAGGGVRALPRRLAHRWLWRERLNTYRVAVSISGYTASWCRTRWGLNTTVVYPPMPDAPNPGDKRNLVAAVGRFAPMKRQDELVRRFVAGGPEGWRFDCVGALSDRPEERAVYDAAVAAADGSSSVRANLARPAVRELLGAAKVFWHAAGVGVDPAADPEALEHFGIAPAEAMSAGCVPVVADRGGPAEVVTHGETGFHCRELDEFVERTRELMADDAKRRRMAAAAIDDSRRFTKAAFLRGMERALADILPTGWATPC